MITQETCFRDLNITKSLRILKYWLARAHLAKRNVCALFVKNL